MQTSFAFYGVYAQLPGDRLWNAAELTQAVTTARDTGAILQVSLRPNPTWWGLTDQDNSQAKQIAQVRTIFFLLATDAEESPFRSFSRIRKLRFSVLFG